VLTSKHSKALKTPNVAKKRKAMTEVQDFIESNLNGQMIEDTESGTGEARITNPSPKNSAVFLKWVHIRRKKDVPGSAC
jgi:hypothetical protein